MKGCGLGVTISAMSYLVAHLRRVPTIAGLNLVARHNNRIGAYTEDGQVREDYPHPLAHPERRGLNEYHCDSAEVIAARTARIEAAGVRRKPQKNAARAVEITVSASPEWFEGKSERESKAYFDAALAALGRRYGAEQIIGWSTHYDETTPHMHVVFVPLVHNSDKGCRYSASEFCGGRKELYGLHDNLAKALAPFGVERGERGEGAEHTDMRGWKRELDRREKELDRREQNLEASRGELDKAREVLVKRYREMEAMWAKRDAELSQREARLSQREREMEAMWAERSRELDAREKALKKAGKRGEELGR